MKRCEEVIEIEHKNGISKKYKRSKNEKVKDKIHLN
jgi:hypothetical protein